MSIFACEAHGRAVVHNMTMNVINHEKEVRTCIITLSLFMILFY
ncbi:hypothetical protein A0O32_1535 [Anoxybacillus flavithermus]|nr:hypothetical protein A0O32_1535 [Anoxybacillus flavithermus]